MLDFSIFPFLVSVFCVLFKRSVFYFEMAKVILFFPLQKALKLFPFIFRCLIHLQLILVYGVR